MSTYVKTIGFSMSNTSVPRAARNVIVMINPKNATSKLKIILLPITIFNPLHLNYYLKQKESYSSKAITLGYEFKIS